MKFCKKCGAQDRYSTAGRSTGACRPCAMANAKRNRELHPEIDRANAARWHAENPERFKEIHAKWRAANKDKIHTNTTKWRAANPEASRVINQNRRARVRNAEGTHTAADIRELMTLQKGKCACCKTSIKDGYHIDHVMPLALEGRNDKLNLQLLCPTCNMQKNARHPVEFMQSRGMLL